jgi:hypothetical protein
VITDFYIVPSSANRYSVRAPTSIPRPSYVSSARLATVFTPTPVAKPKSSYARQRVPSNKRKTLTLFSTYKQMRFEATPIFYSSTTFDLRDLRYITLSTLPRMYSHLVTSFVLDYTMVHDFKEGNPRHARYIEKQMESAKHITVYVPSDTPDVNDLTTQAELLSYTGWEDVDIKIEIE